jgi:hypothetical protein
LIAEVDGRLVRVEVKATRDMRLKGGDLIYDFSFSKGKNKYYPVEIFAFVALDIPSVVYVHGMDLGARGHRKCIGKFRFSECDVSFSRCFFPSPPASAPVLARVAPDDSSRRKKHPVLATNVASGLTTHYGCVADAVADGFTASGISLCLHGRAKAHKGHTFERAR